MIVIVHDNGQSLHGEPADGDPADTGVPAFFLGDRWWRWVSVMDDDVTDGARLNTDADGATLVYDNGDWCDEAIRNRVPSKREVKAMTGGYDPDDHRTLAALHAVAGTVPLPDAARQSGFTAAELVEEAEAWGL